MPRGRRRRQEVESPDFSHGRNTRTQSRRKGSTTSGEQGHRLRRSSRLSNQASSVGVSVASLSPSAEIETTSQNTNTINAQNLYSGNSQSDPNSTSHYTQNRGGRPVDGNQSRQNTSFCGSTQATASNSSMAAAMYNLVPTTQPPPAIRVGDPIYPAFSVQVRHGYGYIDPYEDVNHLMAVATLVSAGNGGPVEGATAGEHFDSVHFVSERDERIDDQVVGQASFPDLTIQQPGYYQIRVTLIRMGAESVNLQVVDSEIISVS